MRVLAVDDEQIALDNLTLTLREFPEITHITAFRWPQQALDWLAENQADIAFLDISMKQLDGLDMAKRIQQQQPACAIVFVTGYSQYALPAIQLHVSGYLIKPVDAEDIRHELAHIMRPTPQPAAGKLLRVQCFGNFEVFANNEPLRFQYSKTKELLAYLVDRRGAFCTNGEIISTLWAEDPNMLKKSSYLRDLRADLTSSLHAAGFGDVLKKQRGRIAIVPHRLDCDYFRWTQDPAAVAAVCKGEYMAQYSWGEITLGRIARDAR